MKGILVFKVTKSIHYLQRYLHPKLGKKRTQNCTKIAEQNASIYTSKHCHRVRIKNMQSDRGSNPGLLAYKASALPTELNDCLTIFYN